MPTLGNDALINHSIPNLFNGISQQSPSIRQPSQCELQENGFSSIVEGVHKRHPTTHIALLQQEAVGDAFVHMINRDATERYVVVITNGKIRVWDLQGNEKVVNAKQGFGYLTSGSPSTDFAVVTIADYTLIANRNIVTQLRQGNTDKMQFVFTINAVPVQIAGPYTARIDVTVNGTTVSKGFVAGWTPTNYAKFFQSQLKGLFGSSCTVTQSGAGVTIQATSPSVTLTATAVCYDVVTDSYGSPTGVSANANSITSFGGTATATSEYQTFSKLPTTGVSGTIYKITGDNSNSFGTYYVKWNGNSYVECTGTGIGNLFDATTMPYQLVREADGTFTFGQIDWKPRLVGDDISAGPPSFIGSKLNDMVFYRNRLGFLSGENVVFSRSGDFFAFFPETATQVLDTDPIDVAVSHIKVSNLRHGVPFSRNLLLFSEQTQFVLAANETLTPSTVTIHQTTEFECSSKSKPVASGSNVYFAVDKSGYTGLREYYVANLQLQFDADDVTAHVPRYIPGNVKKICGSTNEDVIFALSSDTPNAVYVYKYYWAGEEKAQSSWSKWTLKEGSTILTMDLMNTKLFLVVQRSDGVYIEYIDLQVGLKEADLPILVNLDRKDKLMGVFDPLTNKTRWRLDYKEDGLQAVLGGGFSGRAGDRLDIRATNDAYVWEADGNQTADSVYFGVPYTFRYRFSPQFLRDQNKVAIAEAKLKLRHMRVFFTNSGYFRAEVTPEGRDTFTYKWTGKQLGVSSLVLGEPQTDSGVFKFPVQSDSQTCVIELVNDSYLPSFFQSAEWEGVLTSRSTRM